MGNVRGIQKVFKKLDESKPSKSYFVKGRSKELIAKRDELLIHRYFFYRKFSNYRYEVILENLKKEFFISELTIVGILSKDNSIKALKLLLADVDNPKSLKRKFPHLSWSIK